jgi:hypothetical protein
MRIADKRKTDVPSRVDGHLADARNALLENPRVRQRKVRCVAAAGDMDSDAMHLYTLAAGHKFQWTPTDWTAVTDQLDNCELTVEEWLNGNSPA